MMSCSSDFRRSAIILLLAGAACSSGDAGASSAKRAPPSDVTRDSSARLIGPAAADRARYREIPIAAPATLSGTVLLDGQPRPDSTVRLALADSACGGPRNDPSLAVRGRNLGNVVVWVTGIHAGKAPPIDRRFEVTTDQCRYEPHVQAVITGSTINVHNDDQMTETTGMIRLGGYDTLATVTLLDDGGVVPSDKIAAAPGIVELRSAQHPWSRGYVAVFDQPYFAVTANNGSFRIDSLPPGHYTLMAWHERAVQPAVQEFDVAPGGETRLELHVKLK